MPRKVDTAYIEYLPDFSSFARATNRELEAAFRGVEKVASASAKDVQDSFKDASKGVDESFRSVSRSVGSSMREVTRSAESASSDLASDMQRGGERSEDAFRELSRTARTEFNQIEREATKTAADVGGKFKTFGLTAGAALVGIGAAAAAGLGALGALGLTSAAQLEQVQVAFNSLLGSAAEGEKVFKGLQAFAATTPFEFPTVADAGKRFLAFAQSVGMTKAQLQEYLTTIGNVISVTGGGEVAFQSIGQAIGQIGSAGKLTLDNLNQIADAVPGFSPLAAIAKNLGVSTAEASAMISAGTISAQAGVAALLEGMKQFPGAAGAMQAQSETLLGVWSTFKDTMNQTLADAFKPAIPQIKASLTQVTPVIGEALGQVAPAIGNVIASALPALSGLIGAVTPIITPVLDGIATVFKSLKPAIAPLGEALGTVLKALDPIWPVLGDVISALAEGLTPVMLELAPIVADLAVPFADILKALLPLLPSLGQLIGSLLIASEPFIKLAAAAAEFLTAEALVPIVKSLTDTMTALVDPIKKVGEWLDNIDWGKTAESINGAFTATEDAALGFFSSMGTALSDFGSEVSEKVSGAWASASTITANALASIVTFVGGLPARAGTALSGLGSTIAKFFGGAFDRGLAVVRRVTDNIVSFIRGIPKRIGSFAADIGGSIVGFVKSFLNRAISGINQGISAVDSWVPGDLPRLPMLAHGGIAFGPSIIGENPGTAPEAAIPLGDSRALTLLRDALGGGGGTVTFAPGSIVVNVSGDVSPQRARTIGETVGNEIAARIAAARNISTGVRTA